MSLRIIYRAYLGFKFKTKAHFYFLNMLEVFCILSTGLFFEAKVLWPDIIILLVTAAIIGPSGSIIYSYEERKEKFITSNLAHK